MSNETKIPGAGAEPATSVRLASGSDQVGRTGGSNPPTGAIRRRVAMEEGCATCAELARGSFGPYHDPSPRCESGKHPHCTCGTCF